MVRYSFFHQVVADDGVHVAQGGVALGGQHQTFGAAVQPVTNAGANRFSPWGSYSPFSARYWRKRHPPDSHRRCGHCGRKGAWACRAPQNFHPHKLQSPGLLLPARPWHGLGSGLAHGKNSSLMYSSIKSPACIGTPARPFAVYLDALIAEALVHHAGGENRGSRPHKAARRRTPFSLAVLR